MLRIIRRPPSAVAACQPLAQTLVEWHARCTRKLEGGGQRAARSKDPVCVAGAPRLCGRCVRGRVRASSGLQELPGEGEYDMIVVGAGNGACGFLANCQRLLAQQGVPAEAKRVLVLERGPSVTEDGVQLAQDHWASNFAVGGDRRRSLIQLRNVCTEEGRPVLQAGAAVQGGAGALDAAMMFESAAWYAEHLGFNEAYWKDLMRSLSCRFDGDELAHQQQLSPAMEYVASVLNDAFTVPPAPPAAPSTAWRSQPALLNVNAASAPSTFIGGSAASCNGGGTLSVLSVERDVDAPEAAAFPVFEDAGEEDVLRVYARPFDRSGERTNSGESLVDWGGMDVITEATVSRLLMHTPGGTRLKRCDGVTFSRGKGPEQTARLADGGRLVLCAGAENPWLLRPHVHGVQAHMLGTGMQGNILMPLGVQVLPAAVETSSRDHFMPLAAESRMDAAGKEEETVVTFEFHAGAMADVGRFFTHLFMALWVPNWLKPASLRLPLLFELLSGTIYNGLLFVDAVMQFVSRVEQAMGSGQPGPLGCVTVAAVMKFNAAQDGYCDFDSGGRKRIVMPLFAKPADREVAQNALQKHLPLIRSIGQHGLKPWLFESMLRLVQKPLRNEGDISEFLDAYEAGGLMAQLNLSGGCRVGEVTWTGESAPCDTGKVIGMENTYVADLSLCHMPRVSPQMTAYLVGYHVAEQLFFHEEYSANT